MIEWGSSKNHILINPGFPKDQAQYLIETAEEAAQSLRGHIFLLSSGTTANSFRNLKWIALSQEALLSSAAAVNQHLQSDQSDRWLHILPEFHVGGIGIWARAFLSGARVKKLSSWNPAQFVRMAEESQSTLSALVPAQVFDLVAQKLSCPKSFRAVIVGGGSLSPGLLTQARELGWPLLPSYGMTELCSQIATASLASLKDPSEFPKLQILSHVSAGETEQGLLQFRSPAALTGYVLRDSNDQIRWVDPKKDGWFVSQDRGTVEKGFLQIHGRTGEFVKIGGESVELGRLRGVLEEVRIQRGIQGDVALLAVPDERLGHVIHLCFEGGMSSEMIESLIAAYNSQVVAFEKVRKSHRFEKIPRTALQKLIEAECLNLIKASSSLSVPAPSP